MKVKESYRSKEFDNGHYMVEVKTSPDQGLIVDIFFKHMSGDWEFEDTMLIDINDLVTE